MCPLDHRIVCFLEASNANISDNFGLHVADVVFGELVVGGIASIFDQLRLGYPGAKARSLHVAVSQICLHPVGVIRGSRFDTVLDKLGERSLGTSVPSLVLSRKSRNTKATCANRYHQPLSHTCISPFRRHDQPSALALYGIGTQLSMRLRTLACPRPVGD